MVFSLLFSEHQTETKQGELTFSKLECRFGQKKTCLRTK